MLYLVEVHHSGGDYFPERDTADCTRAAVVKDIRTGQIDDVSRVLCVDLDKGTARDVTAEIAQAVLDELEFTPHLDLQNFLECALGCRTVASVVREMEEA